jgi:hypothetical protein
VDDLHLFAYLVEQLAGRLVVVLEVDLLFGRNGNHFLKQNTIKRANDGFKRGA